MELGPHPPNTPDPNHSVPFQFSVTVLVPSLAYSVDGSEIPGQHPVVTLPLELDDELLLDPQQGQFGNVVTVGMISVAECHEGLAPGHNQAATGTGHICHDVHTLTARPAGGPARCPAAGHR